MDIRLLNKNDLSAFIDSDEYLKMNTVPISRHRAFSHINNPRLEKEDVLLLLAYIDKKMVGYLGALPDNIFYKGKFEKMAWLSCLWIDGNYRGKKIAFNLVLSALKAWQNRILITEYTEPAKRLYDKTKQFNQLTEKTGIRLYVRLELHKILINKNILFKKTSGFIKGIDHIGNFFLDFRFLFSSNKLKNLKIEHIDSIDSEVNDFINQRQEKQLFKRTLNELNWIINKPWVLPLHEKKNNQNYYFSDYDKSFDFYPIKVLNQRDTLTSFLVFSKRNDSLKLHYCYSESNYDEIRQVVNHLLLKWKIKTFTCFDDNLSEVLLNNKTPTIYKKKIKRNYLISTFFNKEHLIPNFEIQGGDADCIFT